MLVKCLIWCGIMLVTEFVWKVLEIIEFGHTTPSISETIMGIALVFSLYKNLSAKIGGGQKYKQVYLVADNMTGFYHVLPEWLESEVKKDG